VQTCPSASQFYTITGNPLPCAKPCAPRKQFGEAEAQHAARDADYEAEHHGGHGGVFHNTAEAISHAKYAAGDNFKAKQHAGYVQVLFHTRATRQLSRHRSRVLASR